MAIERDEQFVARGEVQVGRAPGHTGSLGDRRHRQRVEPLVLEQLPGRLEQRRTGSAAPGVLPVDDLRHCVSSRPTALDMYTLAQTSHSIQPISTHRTLHTEDLTLSRIRPHDRDFRPPPAAAVAPYRARGERHAGRRKQGGVMSAFTSAEAAYLRSGPALGRLATVDPTGQPRIVPVGWAYNDHLDVIEIRGRDFAATRKYRDVQSNPKVAFIVDEVLPPWQPRSVIIHGRAEAVAGPDAHIRIHPTRVISWGVEPT